MMFPALCMNYSEGQPRIRLAMIFEALAPSGQHQFESLCQCYIPVYVSEAMNYPTKYVGYVPLVLYLAGCVYSGCVSPMVNLLGKKVVYIITGLLVIGSAIWLEFIKTADDQVWGMAVLLGAGSAGVLILSLAVIGESFRS